MGQWRGAKWRSGAVGALAHEVVSAVEAALQEVSAEPVEHGTVLEESATREVKSPEPVSHS